MCIIARPIQPLAECEKRGRYSAIMPCCMYVRVEKGRRRDTTAARLIRRREQCSRADRLSVCVGAPLRCSIERANGGRNATRTGLASTARRIARASRSTRFDDGFGENETGEIFHESVHDESVGSVLAATSPNPPSFDL